MNLERIIFSVDNPSDIYDYSKALEHLKQLEGMGKLTMIVNCIGSYEGYLEPSFMVYAKEFDQHIRGMFYLEGQQSILRIPGDDRQDCTLEYLSGGIPQLPVGRLKNIPSTTAWIHDSWTYVLETGRYFTTIIDTQQEH